jgi:hypothetical protein
VVASKAVDLVLDLVLETWLYDVRRLEWRVDGNVRIGL